MVDLSAFISDQQTQIFTCGLLLPLEQENAAIALSERITQNNPNTSKFVLNKLTHPPYVRVYETVLPVSKLQDAIQKLEQVSSQTPMFNMEWGAIERTPHLLAIWGKNNDQLQHFQMNILSLISPLREGSFKKKYLTEMNEHEFSAEEEKSFEKWGSPWADPYVPHMIIDKAKPTFSVNKFIPEWDFDHCLFRGLLIGFRAETGDFTHCFQLNFASTDFS